MPAGVRDLDASLLDVANLVLRRWRVVALGGLVGAILFGALSFVVTPTYLAQTSFIQADPSRAGALSGSLGSLAARFGVMPSSLGGSQVSLDFLRRAITSRDVLDSVLLHPLAVDSSPIFTVGSSAPARDSLDLMAFFKARGKTLAKRLDAVRRRLAGGLLKVVTDPKSGMVTVSCRAKDPFVAAALLRRLLAVLNDFNLHTRQSASRANRVFIEGRVAIAKDQLASAEAELRRFYEQNRRLTDAPALLFEEGRLKRQVDLGQQIYVTLSEDLEQARTDEVKDTPVITVIETAQPPVRRYSPRRSLLVLAGGFVGMALVVLWGALKDYMRRESHAASPAWREFERNLATLPGGPRLARRLMAPGDSRRG